jgi:hypothetical protein
MHAGRDALLAQPQIVSGWVWWCIGVVVVGFEKKL